jgi:hypothetical protein
MGKALDFGSVNIPPKVAVNRSTFSHIQLINDDPGINDCDLKAK